MLSGYAVLRDLDDVRKALLKEVEIYFKEKQEEILRQTSDFNTTNIKIKNLSEELAKAREELENLKRNLFRNDFCVEAIKKANKIDYEGLLRHFRNKIQDVK